MTPWDQGDEKCTQVGGPTPGLVAGQSQVLVRIRAIETLINFQKTGLCTQLLGCTTQTYKACACPTSKPKKEPGVSNRDVRGVMDRGAYTSEARSWSDTPTVCGGRGKGSWWQSLFLLRSLGRGDYQLQGN